MRWATAAALLLVLGCPAPSKYAVQRPDLTCDRAMRLAYRAVLGLGYRVTGLVPAHPERTGQVTAERAGANGTESVRVLVTCGGYGATLQPVEEALLPTYEFSRGFGYAFKSLVQLPEDAEDPRARLGLETRVHVVPPNEAILDLGGAPTAAGSVPVRVTVRNNTDRAVRVDPSHIDLVSAAGETASPLEGAALAASIAPGEAGDRVRAALLTARSIAPSTTVLGYLVYPAAPAGGYRDARISIEDVETGESEGFVTPVD
jgi:hypothetical protein